MALPSDNRNQAARYQNVLRRRLIWPHRNIFPNLTHAPLISLCQLHGPAALLYSAPSMPVSAVPPGSQIPAGILAMAHHIPLMPIASRSENVDEWSSDTGMIVKIKSTIPAAYPSA